MACALVFCMGCSGDDGGGGQEGGAEAALAQRDCYLGLQVRGVQHTGFACSGTQTQSSVSGFHPNTLDVALSVSVSLAEAPALGDLTLTSMTIETQDGEVIERWNAPVQACSAVATGSAVDEDFGWTYFRIDVSCSEPALPVDTNLGDPIDLGEFSIVTFFTLD